MNLLKLNIGVWAVSQIKNFIPYRWLIVLPFALSLPIGLCDSIKNDTVAGTCALLLGSVAVSLSSASYISAAAPLRKKLLFLSIYSATIAAGMSAFYLGWEKMILSVVSSLLVHVIIIRGAQNIDVWRSSLPQHMNIAFLQTLAALCGITLIMIAMIDKTYFWLSQELGLDYLMCIGGGVVIIWLAGGIICDRYKVPKVIITPLLSLLVLGLAGGIDFPLRHATFIQIIEPIWRFSLGFIAMMVLAYGAALMAKKETGRILQTWHICYILSAICAGFALYEWNQSKSLVITGGFEMLGPIIGSLLGCMTRDILLIRLCLSHKKLGHSAVFVSLGMLYGVVPMAFQAIGHSYWRSYVMPIRQEDLFDAIIGPLVQAGILAILHLIVISKTSVISKN